MRKILVTNEIRLLAGEYAKGLENGVSLSAKPLDNLKALKKALLLNTTKIVFSAKQFNPKGQKKKYFSADKQPEYAEYIQMIINIYSDINKLQPWHYDNIINLFNSKLKPEKLKVSVKIGSQDPYTFYDLIVKAMDYKGVREKVFPDYLRKQVLDIKTCVYCNAQFAITSETESALTPVMIKNVGK